MERYINMSRGSGVTYFEIADDSITVRFNTGATYLYTYAATGRRNIEEMKRLAIVGQGLNSYISQNVKDRYARKLR